MRQSRLTSKAISIKPDYVDAYNNMGGALKDQGKLDDAIEAYTKAISIKPDYAEAYNNMGNALQRARQARRSNRGLLRKHSP